MTLILVNKKSYVSPTFTFCCYLDSSMLKIFNLVACWFLRVFNIHDVLQHFESLVLFPLQPQIHFNVGIAFNFLLNRKKSILLKKSLFCFHGSKIEGYLLTIVSPVCNNIYNLKNISLNQGKVV